ncbi:MAG: RHS repeat-associated protein, partial [Planctomycetota bacterium]
MGTSSWTSEKSAPVRARHERRLWPRAPASGWRWQVWNTDSERRPRLTLLVCLLVLIGSSSAEFARAQVGVGSPGFQWSFEYDGRGRISSLIDPGGRKTKITYTEHRHNVLKSVIREHASGAKVKSEFDRAGRRIKLTDPHGAVDYKYDKFGRLQSAQRRGGPKLGYTYDSRDRVRTVRIGSEFQVRYDYDYRGRILKLTTPVGPILFSYNGHAGTVERRLPSGVRTSWALDEDDKVGSITHSSADNRLLAHYEYGYRLDGLISAITERGSSGPSTTRYSYDRVQRLIGVRGSGLKVDYAYDSLGNRLSWSRQGQKPVKASYGWAGQLKKLASRSIALDASGNQLQGSDPATTFVFDDRNRMVTAEGPFGRVNYVHDGDGNLVRRSTSSGSTTYLPDPLSETWRPLMIERAGGEATYLIWDGESPLMAIEGQKVRYFLSDQLGSARLVADNAGKLLERRDYEPFGTPLAATGGSDPEPGFAGLFHDPIAGVYLVRARAYDPGLGRFLQRDPELRLALGSQEDLSQYPYCANDPVNFLDRTGSARRSIGAWVMDWASMPMLMSSMGMSDISRTLQRQQQDIRAQQSRMMSDLNRRQQQIRAQQSQMMSRMQSQQMRMRTQQSAMMARMQRQQADMRFRQSRMASDFARQRMKLDRMRRHAAGTSGRIGAAYASAPREIIGMYARTVSSNYLSIAGNAAMASSVIPGIGLLGLVGGGLMLGVRDRIVTSVAQLDTHTGANVRHFGRVFDMMNDIASAGMTVGSVLKTASVEMYSSIGNIYYNAQNRRSAYRVFNVSGNFLRDIGRTARAGAKWWGANPVIYTWYKVRFNVHAAVKIFHRHLLGSLVGDTARAGSSHFGQSIGGMTRSRPGGIRLAGAAQALGELGGLSGVALDESNGRLILLGSAKRRGELPPLRLDDIVTIFRCVYLRGEAPSVTIDPISDSKSEKWMKVGHDPGTEFTYVGWVLFEADRVMKCYGLGQDNDTKRKVRSRVPGYRDFNAIGGSSGKQRWERFWIVPASEARVQGATADL